MDMPVILLQTVLEKQKTRSLNLLSHISKWNMVLQQWCDRLHPNKVPLVGLLRFFQLF